MSIASFCTQDQFYNETTYSCHAKSSLCKKYEVYNKTGHECINIS